MKTERAKGTKEYSPEEKIIKDKIVNTITKIFQLYGFYPIETPTLQRYDLLASKYAGGSEILKETFKLKDQGERELALRYDLTVPLAIYFALNPNTKLPFKRYEIGKVFRDGPISTERFREFWQCDVDIIGAKSIVAEAELINLAFKIFKEFNLSVIIKVNNRKILDGIMNYAEISKENVGDIILIIDKLDKIGKEGVTKELKEKNLDDDQISKIFNAILINGSNKDKLIRIKDLLEDNEGILELEELLKYEPNINLEFSLARGLAYYTGTIYEIQLNDPRFKTSFSSGGRYDNMVGNLIGNTEIPAVGISFGLDRIALALKSTQKTTAEVFILPIKTEKEALILANTLRNNGINTDVDIMSRNISKNLDYANSLEIPYVIFLGEEELKLKKYKLRNMKTGKEELLDFTALLEKLKNG